MYYWNTGTIEIPENERNTLIDALEERSIDVAMVDKGTIYIQCGGDIENGLAEVVDDFVEKGIFLNGWVDYTGDAAGRYEITNGTFESLSYEEAVIRDMSINDLVSELRRRAKLKEINVETLLNELTKVFV